MHDNALPSGTVTFLFTDIEGSTRLWEQHPEQMRLSLIRHDELFERLVTNLGGVVVRPRGEGDSRFAVFPRASDAVAAACAVQTAFLREPWQVPEPLRVRIAVHTGEADLRDGDYYGTAVNRCARLRAIAHGGQIVLSSVCVALVGDLLPAGAATRDLGSHRLKDLGQPERVYQLVHAGLPDDFPPLKSVDVQRTNLPFQATSFIGRDREIAESRQLLGGARLVTITGSGGAGKTRLALYIAADLLNEFDDGVWLAELAPLADGALVPRAVALAVGVAEEPGRPLLETVLDNLRARHALLVLDNCEHVVRAAAMFTEALLRTCPKLRILATSREPLGVAGEIAWSVPPLTLPPADTLATRQNIGATEAVALFLDRADAGRPGFTLTDSNAAAIAEVCRRLDGMPLAIELAAARVRVLSPEQIAQRLDNRFKLLTGGVRTAPTRQQTLQAAIDWSHDLLSPEEQEVFARLSVFAGGFDLEAAEAVCDVGRADARCGELETFEVLDLLAQLVDKSLVVAEPARASGGSLRYRFLDTLREYAAERLAERDHAAVVRAAHARHYVVVAQLAEAHLWGHEQAAWLARLEEDYDNLLAALKWAANSGQPQSGLVLGAAIFRFWAIRHPREGSEWLAKLLSLGGAVDPQVRARALNAAGNLAQVQGDLEQAAALHEACVSIWSGPDNPRERSMALNSVGGVLIELGQYAAARVNLEESLELRRAEGDPRRVAVALANFAELHRRMGDLARAASLGHESLTLARVAGDDSVIATALNNLGSTSSARGQYDEATELLGEAAMMFVKLGNQRGVAECCQRLAEVACFAGEGLLAARLLGASSALRETLGNALVPAERAEYERGVAAARTSIGEQAYAQAWTEGHALPAERVLADVMQRHRLIY